METLAELVAKIKQEGAEVTIKSINDVGDEGERTEKRIKKSNKGSSSSFASLAKKVGLVSLALVAVKKTVDFFKEASDKSRVFSTAISDLSAITGATGDDLEFLRQKSLEFGATTTLSATQAAEAFKLVASAKPDLLDNGEALANVTKEAVTLAEAAGIDLPEAASTLGSSLNQFQEDADQASRFINVLAAGAKFGASEIQDTAMALRDSGTVAAAAGVSFEQLNASIQILSGVSIKGSKAGIGLRNVILSLQSQTNDRLNPAIVGMTTAIKNLGEENLSVTELSKLFGKENVVVAKTLIDNVDNLDSLTGKLTGTGTAYDQAAIKVNNLDGDLKSLNSVFEALQIQIGEKSEPGYRLFIKTLTDVTSSFSQLNKDSESSIGIFETLSKATAIVGFVFEQAVLEVQNLGDGLGFIAASLVTLIAGTDQEFESVKRQRLEFVKNLEKEREASSERLDATLANIETNRINLQTEQKITEEKVKQAEVTKQQAETAIVDLSQPFITEEGEDKKFEAENRSYINRLEALDIFNEDAFGREILAQKKRLELINNSFSRGLIDKTRHDELIEQTEEAHQQRLTDIQNKGLSDREKFEKLSLKAKTEYVLGNIVQLTSGVAQHNKTLFKINKYAAIADTIVSTHSAAQKTFEAYSAYPPLAYALAALTYGAGIARVRAIKATQFTGGGASSAPSYSGSGGGAGGPINTVPIDQPRTLQENRATQPRTTIVLNIAGSVLQTEDTENFILGTVKKAINENDDVIIEQTSRQYDELREAG